MSNEYRNQRLKNMEELKKMGFEPYGGAFKRDGSIMEVCELFEKDKRVKCAGRITNIRNMGKSIFADLRDSTGRIQIYLKKDIVGEVNFNAFKYVDIGDIIGVKGMFFLTHTGEKTINVESWVMLSKALLPLPEKWHGLKDPELKYRYRYLDLISDVSVADRFRKRSMVIAEIRDFLYKKGFIEVETPMMQPVPGGAIAKPFVTHFNALDMDIYLRIAPELYLKRLLVGGFDKIFELNRNFRNEGLSKDHNPEFTMLEIYEAYADVNDMKSLIKELILYLCEKVIGKTEVIFRGNKINLASEWEEVTYEDLIKSKMGADWFYLSVEEMRRKAISVGLEIDHTANKIEITHQIYEKLIEETLIQPTFVTRFPYELIPLAKRCTDNPEFVDVFELEIGGCEVAPGYTELNDPVDQRLRFKERIKEDGILDEDFLYAIEHGMPPAGGMGIGIDRLCMILLEVDSIRDIILFPHLRPKSDS